MIDNAEEKVKRPQVKRKFKSHRPKNGTLKMV